MRAASRESRGSISSSSAPPRRCGTCASRSSPPSSPWTPPAAPSTPKSRTPPPSSSSRSPIRCSRVARAVLSGRGALGQEPVELELEAGEDLVVAEGADGLRLALEVDVGRGAPEAEIGVVGLAGAVHAAAHDGDGHGVLARVAGHVPDLLRQIDERLVLHPRAGGAGDDVEPPVEVLGDRSE